MRTLNDVNNDNNNDDNSSTCIIKPRPLSVDEYVTVILQYVLAN